MQGNMSHDKMLHPFRGSTMSSPTTNTWGKYLRRHLLDRTMYPTVLNTCCTSSSKSIWGLNCRCLMNCIPHFPIKESEGSRTLCSLILTGWVNLFCPFWWTTGFQTRTKEPHWKVEGFTPQCLSVYHLHFSCFCWTQRLTSSSLVTGTLIWRSPLCNLVCNVRPCRSSAVVWWVVVCLVARYVCKKSGTNDFQGFPYVNSPETHTVEAFYLPHWLVGNR